MQVFHGSYTEIDLSKTHLNRDLHNLPIRKPNYTKKPGKKSTKC